MATRRDPVLLPPRASADRVPLRAPAAVPRDRTYPWLIASLLAHLALVAAALFFAMRERPAQDLPPPAFDIVFEGGQPERPAAEPADGLAVPPAPPPLQTAPPAPAPPAPPPLQTAPPAPAPPPPIPAPPQAAEPVRPPPPVAEPPPPAAEALPPPPPASEGAPVPPPPVHAAPPPPPPAAPAPPQPPAPPRQAAPQQAAPRFPPGAVFIPEGLQLGRPAEPAPPVGRPSSGGLDFTLDPRLLEGRATSDPQVRVTGAEVGADWRAAFRRWLDENIRYPRRAIELRESGSVRVEVIAEADGRVRSVRLVGPSGSPSLNLATTMPFGGARLPAFPPPADPGGVTIELTVNYVLVRR